MTPNDTDYCYERLLAVVRTATRAKAEAEAKRIALEAQLVLTRAAETAADSDRKAAWASLKTAVWANEGRLLVPDYPSIVDEI